MPPQSSHQFTPGCSVQGDCAGIPPQAGTVLDPPVTSIGQCIITAAAPLMELRSAATLLLTDVYVLISRPVPTPTTQPLTLITIVTGSLWMQSAVLRGDRRDCRGVDVGLGQRLHSRSAVPCSYST